MGLYKGCMTNFLTPLVTTPIPRLSFVVLTVTSNVLRDDVDKLYAKIEELTL